MRRLICTFVVRIWLKQVFSWRSSYDYKYECTVLSPLITVSCAHETNTNEPRHDKTNKMSVRPVWSESLLCTHWVAKDPNFLHADSENSDQTGHPRLIWVSPGRRLILLVLSWGGSNQYSHDGTKENNCMNFPALCCFSYHHDLCSRCTRCHQRQPLINPLRK